MSNTAKLSSRREVCRGLGLLAGIAASSQAVGGNYRIVYQMTGMKPLISTEFETHTFSSVGQSGRSGPSLQQCLSAYEETEILKPEYQFAVSNGIQSFLIPVDGTYQITAYGASGQNINGSYGQGAIMQGEIPLKAGDLIRILVGQRSTYVGTREWQGGSGGTFVARNNEPLVVAGGGGTNRSSPSSSYLSSMRANTGTQGKDGSGSRGGRDGGNAAPGGHHECNGGGAAGFYSNGHRKTDTRSVPSRYGGSYKPAYAFINGGLGGEFATNYDSGNSLHGAFGCGGPGGWGGAGGGGGYSGGGNCRNTGYSGGGGSFITAAALAAATSDGTFVITGNEPTPAYRGEVGHLGGFHNSEGKVVITFLKDS